MTGHNDFDPNFRSGLLHVQGLHDCPWEELMRQHLFNSLNSGRPPPHVLARFLYWYDLPCEGAHLSLWT